jgi:tetratricopeptide (TPR) repeat protein/glutathione synthase/RimK-type ligase-like ATP-grasp enzyme
MTQELEMARVLAEQGHLAQALQQCMMRLDREPQHVPALDRAAKILLQGGAFGDAIKAIERIIALVPQAIAPFGQRARACLALGHGPEAARLYRALAQRCPPDPASLLYLGQGLAQCGEISAATELLARALDFAPTSEIGLAAANGLASLAYQSGDLVRAERLFDQALVHHPHQAELHHNLAVVRFELGQMEASAMAGARALALMPQYAEALSTTGQALFRHGNWPVALGLFKSAVRLNDTDVRAHMGIYYLAEARGDHALARIHQAQALALQQVYSDPCVKADAPSILILEAPGDFQANLPIGFLLSTADYHLHRYVLMPDKPLRTMADLPEYDLVFNAISEPDHTRDHLILAQQFIDGQTRPVINIPANVARTTRDFMASHLADIPNLIVPVALRVDRNSIERWHDQGLSPDPRIDYPILLRPVGTHAGHDLEKIENPAALKKYLATITVEQFYLTQFFDYARISDGLYRKFRAIIIDGVPWPFHMAIRDHWMVHYYNAHMERSSHLRAEEQAYLADMKAVIGQDAIDCLKSISDRIGIDYFGVDFAVTPEGKVVLFEVDVAAIVHMMDDKVIYAYKHQYVPPLIAAAKAMVARHMPNR